MRELPEPEGQLAWQTYTRDQVLAIQKQAYEDGLRDAGKDAERYRWLAENKHVPWGAMRLPINTLLDDGIDAAIDAAMLTASQKG